MVKGTSFVAFSVIFLFLFSFFLFVGGLGNVDSIVWGNFLFLHLDCTAEDLLWTDFFCCFLFTLKTFPSSGTLT